MTVTLASDSGAIEALSLCREQRDDEVFERLSTTVQSLNYRRMIFLRGDREGHGIQPSANKHNVQHKASSSLVAVVEWLKPNEVHMDSCRLANYGEWRRRAVGENVVQAPFRLTEYSLELRGYSFAGGGPMPGNDEVLLAKPRSAMSPSMIADPVKEPPMERTYEIWPQRPPVISALDLDRYRFEIS